jgi:predicted nicotinamide N-methyase
MNPTDKIPPEVIEFLHDYEKEKYIQLDPEVKYFLNSLINDEFIETVNLSSLQHYDSWFYWSIVRNIMGFVSPTLKWARSLKNIIGDKTVLEVGAGTGLVAKYLNEVGVKITATDNYSWYNKNFNKWKWFYPIVNLDFKAAIEKYHVDYLLLSWPPYREPMAKEAAKLFTKLNQDRLIIYIGEGLHGCTADDDFHKGIKVIDELDDVNDVFPQWRGLHDQCYLVKWR